LQGIEILTLFGLKSWDMSNGYSRGGKSPVSPQALAVLELVAASKRPLSATQIASQLNVMPQAAHRALASLLHFGLVRSVTIVPGESQPAFHICQTYRQAKRAYLLQMHRDFDDWFGETLRNSHANRIYNS
jgi:predicted transcriptional regulator